jgi:hypothetical protein
LERTWRDAKAAGRSRLVTERAMGLLLRVT